MQLLSSDFSFILLTLTSLSLAIPARTVLPSPLLMVDLVFHPLFICPDLEQLSFLRFIPLTVNQLCQSSTAVLLGFSCLWWWVSGQVVCYFQGSTWRVCSCEMEWEQSVYRLPIVWVSSRLFLVLLLRLPFKIAFSALWSDNISNCLAWTQFLIFAIAKSTASSSSSFIDCFFERCQKAGRIGSQPKPVGCWSTAPGPSRLSLLIIGNGELFLKRFVSFTFDVLAFSFVNVCFCISVHSQGLSLFKNGSRGGRLNLLGLVKTYSPDCCYLELA